MAPTDPAAKAVESTLRLWAMAFYEITKYRRHNILRQTAPYLIPLLADSSLFSNLETTLLFGTRFVKALAKEVD